MKVILLQDVAKIGKRSELVDVPDGYALNQLIPKHMAEPATKSNRKKIEKIQADAQKSEAANQERFTKAAEALQNASIIVEAEANDQGHLFKAVSENDIADAAATAGVDVDSAMIQVGEPIKSTGTHQVSLVRGDSVAEFAIDVQKAG